jgi:hypothetical protein
MAGAKARISNTLRRGAKAPLFHRCKNGPSPGLPPRESVEGRPFRTSFQRPQNVALATAGGRVHKRRAIASPAIKPTLLIKAHVVVVFRVSTADAEHSAVVSVLVAGTHECAHLHPPSPKSIARSKRDSVSCVPRLC